MLVVRFLKTISERRLLFSFVHKLYTRKHLGTAADKIESEQPRTSPWSPPGSSAEARQGTPAHRT